MRVFNYIFCFLLFAGFFLPTNSTFYPLGLPLTTREFAFILLPLVNLCCWSTKSVKLYDKNTQYLILFFIALVLFTEFVLKIVIFGTSLLSPFKVIYVSLPLFSCYFLLLTGIKANVEMVWRTMLLAVISSVIISLVALVYFIPIYSDNEEVDILVSTMGRLGNSNAPFGIIGLYLLFKDKEKWYNKGILPKLASILSIMALLLTFNRTYLILAVIGTFYLCVFTLSWKTIKGIFVVSIVVFFTIFVAYHKSEPIKEQIDNRILSIFFDRSTVLESAVQGNRDVIYQGVQKRIEQGYWVIGMPFETPIFVWEDKGAEMKITDTTIFNILLRFGIIPLFLFLLIYFRLYKKANSSFVTYPFVIYFFAALNMDALFRHNSVLFLVICIFIVKYNVNSSNIDRLSVAAKS